MKIRILGCGGSFGSPLAWSKNGNIDINNNKNYRTRSSVLISKNESNILIDIIHFVFLPCITDNFDSFSEILKSCI